MSNTPTTRKAPLVVRVLMGLMFTVFGLNGFLNFIPQPKEPMPAAVIAFTTALVDANIMKVVFCTQLLVGILLLLNRFVPLALALIAPIIVGILTFHISLALSSIMPGIVVLALELYLAWSYRDAFRPMLAGVCNLLEKLPFSSCKKSLRFSGSIMRPSRQPNFILRSLRVRRSSRLLVTAPVDLRLPARRKAPS